MCRWVVVVVGTLVCPLARAQTSIEPPVVNPGARSLALGGAFVAVADDATAAYANPSGLVQLVRPEISLELRTWSDDREGVTSNLSGVGFVSFVLPRQRWALALYGQTLANVDAAAPFGGDEVDFSPLSTLTIANLGASAALRVGDAVSLGLGLAAFRANSTGVGIDVSQAPSFYPIDETCVESGVIAGGLWTLSDAWAIGVSYRSGADFRFSKGRQASLPDLLAAGARWRSVAGHATVAVELERLSGVDDRTRLHLGGEWAFLSARPLIALRAGMWHDPSDGFAVDITDRLSVDDGETHIAAGIGAAFKRFQIDLGADFSERSTIVSISAIVTF